MDLVKAEALLSEATAARMATGATLDTIGDKRAALAMAERAGDLDLETAVLTATQALSTRRPLSRDHIETFTVVQARRGLIEAIRRGLTLDMAAATLAHREALATEAESEAILLSERLTAHLEAQGRASEELARLEGGTANITVEGKASNELKHALAAARDRAEFLRSQAEAELLAFEVAKATATASTRRIA